MEFRLAKKEDLKECVRVYADAFNPYEFSKIYCPKNEKRSFRFTRAIHRIAVNIYFKRKMLFVGVENERIVGCACMDAPSQKPMTMREYLRNGAFLAAFVGGLRNLAGYAYMVMRAEKHCASLQKAHWYLCDFAVDPKFQHQGFGSRMLQEGLFPYIAKNGGGELYLVTNSQKNADFYSKNNFTEIFYEDLALNKKILGNWTFKTTIAAHP